MTSSEGPAGRQRSGERPNTSPARGRGGRTLRDLGLSLAVLAGMVLVLTGLSRGCSFSPGGISVDPHAVPTVDQSAELRSAAARVGFSVRDPRLPAGWRANSADVSDAGATPGGPRVVQVGWLTAAGRYLRFAQSSADSADLARFEAGRPPGENPVSTGTVDVAGRQWTVYPGLRDEPSWLTDLGGVRLLITGSGSPDEFRTLAAAAQSAPVLPRSP
ncbi:DUF4245 domain-containing protein [Gandjariella thermophila]|uniref:DUF4245 domain-containing protein n=1 Tax=Gandjariella thermophila TaxID=1931992 RepID=A0A4D4J010_9PSEU|nr:DUF4245 domain-containing protein [Gandjariella thermophila]GDY29935.1 hypothetical protein GTS_15680 [Gandjariella thermophila]